MTNKIPVVGQSYRRKCNTYEVEVIGLYKPETRWLKIVTDNPNFNAPTSYSLEDFLDMFEELPTTLQKTEEICQDCKECNKFCSFKCLSESKLRNTVNPVDLDKGEVNEVERALERLKKEIKISEQFLKEQWAKIKDSDTNPEVHTTRLEVVALTQAAQDLVNALEAEKKPTMQDTINLLCNIWEKEDMSKSEPKIDIQKPSVDSVSIWKDVSELPEGSCSVILKDEQGRCQNGDYLKPFFMTDGKKFNCVKYITTTDFINSFEQLQRDVNELKGKINE